MANSFKSAKLAAGAGALLGVAFMWIGFQVATGGHTGIMRKFSGAKQLFASDAAGSQAAQPKQRGSSGPNHSVTLTWKASTTPGARYNVYRRDLSGAVSRPNSAPISVTTYTDTSVRGGQTYFYTTKSVGPSGTESKPSNEVRVDVPSP